MDKREFHFGPGAATLMVVVVVVIMSIIALLTVLSVRSDVRLTERAAELYSLRREAQIAAEYDLARLDAAVCGVRAGAGDDGAYRGAVQAVLPDGYTLEGDIISWQTQAGDGGALDCAVRLEPLAGDHRLTWVRHRYTSGDQFDAE